MFLQKLLASKSAHVLGEVSKLKKIRNSGLACDVVEFSKYKFSELEKTVMEAIRHLKTEQTYIIKNGQLDEKIKFNRGKNFCDLVSGQSAELIDDVMKDATVVHNHPSQMSLSCQDVATMAKKKLKKMVATAPDGGFSVLERSADWTDEQHYNFIIKCNPLINAEFSKYSELGAIRGIRNTDRFNMLNDWRCEQFKILADEFGLTFKNEMGKERNTKFLPRDVFKINYAQEFFDNMIFYKNAILKNN